MEVMECDGGTILFGKAPLPPIFPIPLSDKSRPSEASGFKIFVEKMLIKLTILSFLSGLIMRNDKTRNVLVQ